MDGNQGQGPRAREGVQMEGGVCAKWVGQGNRQNKGCGQGQGSRARMPWVVSDNLSHKSGSVPQNAKRLTCAVEMALSDTGNLWK